MSSNNLGTSEYFLGFGMKGETYEPDSPKISNACEISLITALNNLCKPLPIFRVDNNAPLHYTCLSLKQ